jgi:hypothetical protein
MSSRFRRSLEQTVPALFLFAFAAAILSAQTPKKIDPCALLTKTEIQEVLGQPVKDGKLAANANPAVGSPCQYVVGDYGAFSVLVKPLGPVETPDKIQSMLGKMMKTSDAPGIGDKSFFAFPGYGMVQLNTFKGSSYVIMTLMVPGLSEDAHKAPAEKLMKKVLPKL